MGMKPYTTATYALDLIGVGFWRRRIRMIVRTAFNRGLDGDYWLTPQQRSAVILEARVHIALWALIAGASVAIGTWAALYFWLAPLLLTKAFHQLQNTGEHTGLAHDPNTFLNTRTLKGPAPMRWVMWNMSFHTAHHCFPGVPFNALPALHGEIVKGLDHPVPTRGYIEAQREIFSLLRAAD